MEAVQRMKEGKCEEAVQLLRDANIRYKNEPEDIFRPHACFCIVYFENWKMPCNSANYVHI